MPPSPARELASSAFMSFWMNNIAVELALVTPLLAKYYGPVDDQQMFLTFMFLHLSFFFSPLYANLSGKACNNPTVYFLLYLTGKVPLVQAAVGFLCTIVGTCVGTFAYAAALETFPMAGYKGISAVKAAGGMYHGAAAEAAVAFVNFTFAGLVQPMFGAMGPYAGAFFYVVTITVERCAYSCGFMNPAVVFATHALKGDLTSRESIEHVATYFVGALGGAAAVALVNALVMPAKVNVKGTVRKNIGGATSTAVKKGVGKKGAVKKGAGKAGATPKKGDKKDL
mmetsp:Transcript_12788/g.20704  ORF Transcript_12788/g.20704 Transcript_12788/m.20704 type:complete len:283 (-) Transcript_12788:118-966(-)